MTDLRRITRALHFGVRQDRADRVRARARRATASSWSRPAAPPRRSRTPASTVIDVSELTGFPEMMDGRVKTLHPKVHGGLLAIRDNKEHAGAMAAHGIGPIDLLVVNLYPFEATVAKGAAYDDCIENIDIGGPAMIRAAAKNHADVAVVVEPEDYAALLDELSQHGGATTLALRKKLAAKAYARTAAYDAAISNWFARRARRRRAGVPRLRRQARRGAALRREPAPERGVLSRARAARPASPPRGRCRASSSPTTTSTTPTRPMNASPSSIPSAPRPCAIIKHANPCGVAEGAQPRRGLSQGAGLRLRPRRSAASSRSTARSTPRPRKAITEIFTEVIIAPDASDEAIAIVGAKKNLRLLLAGGLPDPRADGLTVKSVAGGLLVQSRDNAVGRRDAAQDRDQARADRGRAATTCASPSASPSTSSRTPSSMPRTAPPSASAPAR